MYSILASQRRKLIHKKQSPITCGCFVTDNYVLFCFENGTIMLLNQQQDEDIILSSSTIPHTIVQCCRIKKG